mmetsp:Transcript_5497/g.18429  ORF Transcript_5497/g.18429 Transcript_5497/m.18429 type:complete len:246 (+) Transcript_5497:43-780(+)
MSLTHTRVPVAAIADRLARPCGLSASADRPPAGPPPAPLASSIPVEQVGQFAMLRGPRAATRARLRPRGNRVLLAAAVSSRPRRFPRLRCPVRCRGRLIRASVPPASRSRVPSCLHDGVPRLLRRLVHPQPLPPLPLALPRRRKGVVRAALLHAGQHFRGAHRLDVRRLLRRRLGRAARRLPSSALPLALVVCCSALDAAALVHARRLRCHPAAGRRPTANLHNPEQRCDCVSVVRPTVPFFRGG